MRSGTENVPGVAGLGAAAAEMYRNHQEKLEHLYELKEHMMKRVAEIDGVVINSLDPLAPDYRSDLAQSLTAVGSVFPLEE